MYKAFYPVLVFARINIKRFFRDKTALFFTIIFPLIFLFIFGGIFGRNGSVNFKIAMFNQSNTPFSRNFSNQISSSKEFSVDRTITTMADANQKMSRGQIDATLILPQAFGQIKDGSPAGQVKVLYDENNASAAQTITAILQGFVAGVNEKTIVRQTPLTVASVSTNTAGLTQFDYTFSGLLGFAIIGLGIFGPVNVFPELKKQGVLRRIHVTPIKVWQYFISNVISQAVIGLISIAIMFIVAKVIFHLKMSGSYLDLAVIVVIGIFTIFGIGLAIGGWAKNQNQAAPLSNIVVFPLMFLTGVFFPTYLMPVWLQNISTYLPLTPVINSIRLIITENKGLTDLGPQIGIIAVWAVVIYFIAFKVFRWE